MKNNYASFQKIVMQKGKECYRDMPWRHTNNPYHILVSEIMLQQTQVDRVIPFYHSFILRYPTVHNMAEAPFSEILALWNGLGYNRRAKYLHQSAGMIQSQYAGHVPRDISVLTSLPGVGHNTAAAICVYAYNRPEIFIETNIRTVYIYHFFPDLIQKVSDKTLLPIIEKTLCKEDPRKWYWALMDYGAYLKKTLGNVARKSASYKKQSAFSGSPRQLRGRILKFILVNTSARLTQLQEECNSFNGKTVAQMVNQLCDEGFLVRDKNNNEAETYIIADVSLAAKKKSLS